jgi:hypothetical protein
VQTRVGGSEVSNVTLHCTALQSMHGAGARDARTRTPSTRRRRHGTCVTASRMSCSTALSSNMSLQRGIGSGHFSCSATSTPSTLTTSSSSPNGDSLSSTCGLRASGCESKPRLHSCAGHNVEERH